MTTVMMMTTMMMISRVFMTNEDKVFKYPG